MTFSVTVFAEDSSYNINDDVKTTKYSFVLDSNGIVSAFDENEDIMPRSSISGYQDGNVSKHSPGFLVWVDSSGIGGMGVTVKTMLF